MSHTTSELDLMNACWLLLLQKSPIDLTFFGQVFRQEPFYQPALRARGGLKKFMSAFPLHFNVTYSADSVAVVARGKSPPNPKRPRTKVAVEAAKRAAKVLLVASQAASKKSPTPKSKVKSPTPKSRVKSPTPKSKVKSPTPKSNVKSPAPKSKAAPGIPADDRVVVPEHTMISWDRECQDVCNILRTKLLLAFDAEGVNLGARNGSLTLIQCHDGTHTYLFDVMSNPGLWDAGLRDLLQCVEVTKLFHDCRADASAIKRASGVILQRIFDTQVAHGARQHQHHGRSSLDKMLREVIGRGHPYKASAPHVMDGSAWRKRPLPAASLRYAVLDVTLLHEAGSELLQTCTEEEIDSVFRVSLATVKDATSRQDHEPSRSREEALARLNRAAHREAGRQIPLELEQDAEFQAVLDALPGTVAQGLLLVLPDACDVLVDIVLDLHRCARYIQRGPSVDDEQVFVTSEMLDYVLDQCGPVSDANRACIGKSLHRCSVIRDGPLVVGLTIRMARVMKGIAQTIEPILLAGHSILLIGAPGRGKTTLLRDISRLLASRENDRRVMIVDTNNEIAGEHALPHRAIGRARRMKVGPRSRQHAKMIEAVQNHTPEVLVIDEIGTSQEAREAVSVTQRGVQLIATTHGRSIAEVIQSPSVNALLGGCNTVILSSHERAEDGAKGKTRIERKTKPAFTVCIELLSLTKWRIHHDVERAVDVILRGLDEVTDCEVRTFEGDHVLIATEAFPDQETRNAFEAPAEEDAPQY